MSDTVTRLNEALEGRYRVESEIGEGGMATVYLADDLKHERKVALKVLKPELAAVVGGDRFLAEIKTTANLQHPHILPLFDSGEADGFLFYVMPYIDGETLRDRIDRERQLPVDEALGIATAIAGALQTAHDLGVVHRDIKPGNILLSRGQPLVADFGIALAVSAGGGGRLTETGLSLGTPFYMSPEQATGDQQVGPASDTFALACVLYEMLVGEPPYPGSTAQAVLGKIIQGAPVSATAVRQSVPSNVDAAIRKALEKLPADRFTGAQDFARALADPGYRHGGIEAVQPEASVGRWNRLSLGLAAAVVALAGVAAWGWLRPVEAPGAVATRLPLDVEGMALSPFDDIIISPDGSHFAVTGRVSGEQAVYVRPAGETAFRILPGTEGADYPAFSPDGDWIAYLTESNDLVKVAIAGGAPRPVVPTGDLLRGYPHWAEDGTIVFKTELGLQRVPDTGGAPELLFEGAEWLRNIQLLPGSRAVLGADARSSSIVLLDLETDSVTELIQGGIDPTYVGSGHLLYSDLEGGLWAVELDAAKGELAGEPVPLFGGVSTSQSTFARFAVSETGTLVYGAGGGGGATSQQLLVVVGLDGAVEANPLTPRPLRGLRWSPDGETVAYSSVEPGDTDSDIFTYNVELRTEPRRLTREGINFGPVWSPDGGRIAFRSARADTDGGDLFVKSLTDELPELLAALPDNQTPSHWPSDDVILFEMGDFPADIWTVDPSADSASATLYVDAEAGLADAVLSPDGTLAAYVSFESGMPEVYVRSFPEPRQPEQVSRGSGTNPVWAPDGTTLYFWSGQFMAGSNLVAARIQRAPSFVVTSIDTLFSGAYVPASADLHPDGDRFVVAEQVMSSSATSTTTEQFFVVVNFFEEMRRLMGRN